MNNIPIYRAKQIDSDKWVEGILLPYLKRFNNKSFIINDYTRMQDLDNALQIDPKTIAIHFPNMIDKNSKKIFASLSKDGVGGDLINCNHYEGILYEHKLCMNEYSVLNIKIFEFDKNGFDFKHIEVVGIHKGKDNETRKTSNRN